MKVKLIKFICFFTGADWRKFFPEKWDLSQIRVHKQYGGNDGFLKFYKSFDSSYRFCNGIDVQFYGDSFTVKRIIGYTRSSICFLTINKNIFNMINGQEKEEK